MGKNITIRHFYFLLFSAFLLSLSACQKKEPVSWESDLYVPLLTSTMDVWDLFGDTNVVENSDQSLRLLVEEKVEMLDPDKVIEVHDTLAIDLFNIPLYLKFAPGQQLTQRETSVTMDLDDMELTQARARIASLKFYVTNTVKEPLRVKYELLSSDKNGQHFEVFEDIPPATNSGPSYTVKTIHLDGYNMDMTGDGTQVNTVRSKTTVWIHPDADSVWIIPADTILIISTFDELKIDYAHGYFGQQGYEGQGSSYIGVFNNFKAGSFDLDKANASLTIRNYSGMDVRMKMNKLSSFNSAVNQEVMLNHSIIGQTLNVQRATENGTSLEDVNPTISTYPIENSNLDKLIEIQPDSLRFKLSAEINPMGNVSAGNDFMYFEKGIEAVIKLDVPLNFSTTGLKIEDHSSLNFDKDKKLKSGELLVHLDNMMPFDMDIQFYVLDENKVIIDSLFETGSFIGAAQLDAQGIAELPTHTLLSIPLTKDKIEVLRKYSDLLIRAKVNSVGNKKYQLFKNNNLIIRIVGDVKYEIN
jgi:hypothetical protein